MVGKIMKEYGSRIIENVRIEDLPFGDPSSPRLAVISEKCPIFRPYLLPAIFLPAGEKKGHSIGRSPAPLLRSLIIADTTHEPISRSGLGSWGLVVPVQESIWQKYVR